MSKSTSAPVSTLSATEGKKVTFYMHEGVRYMTPANWKLQGLAPSESARPTVKTTKQGYEFNVFAESEVAPYDANAELKKRQAIKELNAEKRDLMKAFMAHEIDASQYTKRDAEIASALVQLNSL